jgi:glycosyltransferase involved in cell wall biosynthesis
VPPRNDKIRVLALIDSLGTSGGGERIAFELARHLDADRFHSTLCVSRWSPAEGATPAGSAALTSLAEAGVEFLGLERGSRASLRPWLSLRRHLRENQTDVLHSHKFGSNLWGALVGPSAGVPVFVAHEHSWSYEGRPLRKLADRRLISRRADALIAVSGEDRRRMIEVEGIDSDRIRLIPNGMPPVRELDGGDVRAELGIGDAPVLGAVSTIRPEKGLDLLVGAAAELSREVPRLQVVIAGDGDGSPLRRRAEELGIGDRLHLLGFRSDIGSVIASFDVAVNASEREGTPLSILEYMDAGVPVVATAVGGVPEMLGGGEAGVLVEPGDPAAIARAAAGLLSDPARASEVGEAGRRRRRGEFSMETMVSRVEDLYVELTGR